MTYEMYGLELNTTLIWRDVSGHLLFMYLNLSCIYIEYQDVQ